MKTSELIIAFVLIVAAGFVGWQLHMPKQEAMEQTSNSPDNAAPMSVSYIHQTDSFYNVQVEYPQFNNADAAFNKKISDLITGKIASFKQDAKANYDARKATATPDNPVPDNPTQPFDFIGSWEPAQINNNYISFVVHLYYFTGGAHGVNEVYAFNYDLKNQKEISIMDFLNSSQDELDKFAQLASQSVSTQLQSSGMQIDDFMQQMIDAGTKATVDNYKNFTFNDNSITVYFQQYQVAPGAVGEQDVTFYKSTLDSNSIGSSYLQ